MAQAKPAPIKRTLAQVSPDARTVSHAQWKAWELNKLFEEQGRMKQPGNFQPETITHGESTWRSSH